MVKTDRYANVDVNVMWRVKSHKSPAPPNNFEWALEMQIEDLDGNVLRIGSDAEKMQPLGVWRHADGIAWRHLGSGKYERLA